MLRRSSYTALLSVAVCASFAHGYAHAGEPAAVASDTTPTVASDTTPTVASDTTPTVGKVSPADMARLKAADPQGSLPEEGKHLRIDEKVGDTVPRDISFLDTEGNKVTLADYLDGDLPVILTFNYSSCPMLCSAQLRGLIEAMNQMAFTAGEQYRIVSIGIDHLETPSSTKATKDRYVESFPDAKQASVRKGWSFLSGDEKSIRTMADAVGFPFEYLEDEKEFAHPASLIFLSPSGVVTRYYHGIYYDPQEFSRSIFQAGVGEHGISVGFLLACLRPNHEQGFAEAGVSAMRYGALGFLLFMLAAFGSWQMIRTRSAKQAREEQPVGTSP